MKHPILRGSAGVLVLSLCLSLAACGGGDDDTSADPPANTPPATTPGDTPATPVLHCAP